MCQPSDIREAARILAANRPGALLYAMGITQHTTGHQNVLACANLQMLLGNLGVPGGGVNPLRGQNNVQGACDMGCLPNLYPGYQSVAERGCAGKGSRGLGQDRLHQGRPDGGRDAQRRRQGTRSRRCSSWVRTRG